ncbi:hypothetical protein N7466_008246 [Penicillium verhagenii]|uniref:uncharacterized protein n=1 Tax=Penicillium verhagenii TaxID=1562060 RepID=UPI0025455928|nr:uncharacterized protein N7466_008246 [Penicillium verhagenii]KAJ5924059.1 hypothetical protein N7466_008246 [Penicillium verhagenii]
MSSEMTEEEYNLQEVWDRVCASFAQTTKIDLTTKPKYSVDQVLEQIRAKQSGDDEQNSKYRAAKDVIQKTLKFVTVLGGIAAQGASMVFAPSSLCFNAISYLIDTGAKYKRIFSSLANLFRRISDVLERCKIYLRLPPNTIDISLRRIINDELLCFVDICALSIKVLSGNKVLTALKVFAFDSDEGVSGQLARLAMLVERETQMRATLGFELQITSMRGIIDISEGNRKISASVDKMISLQEKKEAERAEKKVLDDIDASLDTPSVTQETLQKNHKRILGERVKGSGEWLHKNVLYTSWAHGLEQGFSILGISGAQGRGKSFLFATIVERLRQTSSQIGENLTCTSTAYYNFGSQNQESSLINALKVLAWQIVKTDIVYRKDLSSVETDGIDEIATMWNTLFAKSYKSDSTFILMLDSIELMNQNHFKGFAQLLAELQVISSTWSKFKLRILLSGRCESVSKLRIQIGGGISVIDVASQNKDDMGKFIDHRLDKMSILKGLSDPVLDLRRDILQCLTTETSGDYVNVSLLLHEISGKQRPSEIRNILSRSGGKRSDTIARKIELLNETLSDEDISDLNEILTWTVVASRPLSLAELEAVLFAKNREASLRPLAEKIMDRYSSMLRIMGEPHPISHIIPRTSKVVLISDSINDFLRANGRIEMTSDVHGSISTENVNEFEVRIVRRFLESVCDSTLFSKFGFDDFFQQKLIGKAGKIGIEIESAHLRVVSTCLKTFLPPTTPNLAPLLPFAIDSLAYHLKQADLSLVQPQYKAAIGPDLVRLFTDEQAITIWWEAIWKCYDPSPHLAWILEDDNTEAVLRWLRDSAVSKSLSDQQSQWVSSLTSKYEPDADVLDHISKILARQWLQQGLREQARPFIAVNGIQTKIENRKNPQIERSTAWPGQAAFDTDQILSTAAWAQSQLGLDQLKYIDHIHIAQTMQFFDNHEGAIERFKLASSLEPHSSYSLLCLSECYAELDEYELAIEVSESARKAVLSSDPEGCSEKLDGIDANLAEWYARKDDHPDRGIAIYEAMQHRNPGNDRDQASGLIALYHKARRHDTILEFMQSLKDTTDDVTGETLLVQTFFSFRSKFHSAMFALVQSGIGRDIILEGYEAAILAAETQAAECQKLGEEFDLTNEAFLHHQLAFLCYWNDKDDPERRKLAIERWLHLLEMDEASDDLMLGDIKTCALSGLTRAYFNEALGDKENASFYLDQMSQLATFTRIPDHRYSMRDGTYPTQLIARYYVLQGDEKRAMDTLRGNIKLSLDLLSDDDPLNDWQGYEGLAVNLMYAGQDADCLAAWSLITPEKSIEVGEIPENTPSGLCVTGAMEAVKPTGSSQMICMCLRRGDMDVLVCDKNHDMMHVPAYDLSERQSVGDGNVRVGERIVKIDDWVHQIRERWGILG